jgi:hypothetical protein
MGKVGSISTHYSFAYFLSYFVFIIYKGSQVSELSYIFKIIISYC